MSSSFRCLSFLFSWSFYLFLAATPWNIGTLSKSSKDWVFFFPLHLLPSSSSSLLQSVFFCYQFYDVFVLFLVAFRSWGRRLIWKRSVPSFRPEKETRRERTTESGRVNENKERKNNREWESEWKQGEKEQLRVGEWMKTRKEILDKICSKNNAINFPPFLFFRHPSLLTYTHIFLQFLSLSLNS